MAQPARGWCDRPLRKHAIERFVPQRLFVDTKRLNDGSWCIPQTTSVPLRGASPPDLRRGARKTSTSQLVKA
jgi:hypothetical protein